MTPSPSATASPAVVAQPFRLLGIERYALDPAGDAVIDWSTDETTVVYQSNGRTADTLSRFALQTHTSTRIVSDMVRLSEHPHLRSIWNHATDTITYARMATSTAIDIVTIDRDGRLRAVLVAAVDPALSRIGPNGEAILVAADHVRSIGPDQASRVIALAPMAEHFLTVPHETYPASYPPLWLAPDGQHYAVAYQNDLYLFTTEQETPLQQYTFPTGVIHEVVWSPDSTALYFRRHAADSPTDYYGSYVQTIVEAEPQPLGRGQRLVGVGGVTDGVTWSPDSRWLVVGYGAPRQCGDSCEERQVIVDPFAAAATVVLTGTPGLSGPAAWSPTMSQIAKPCYRGSDEHPRAELCIVTMRKR